jgi:hypothetical protein
VNHIYLLHKNYPYHQKNFILNPYHFWQNHFSFNHREHTDHKDSSTAFSLRSLRSLWLKNHNKTHKKEMIMSFPTIGNFYERFSNHWKLFQGLENYSTSDAATSKTSASSPS